VHLDGDRRARAAESWRRASALHLTQVIVGRRPQLDQAVGERGLSVIDVRDDAKVAHALAVSRRCGFSGFEGSPSTGPRRTGRRARRSASITANSAARNTTRKRCPSRRSRNHASNRRASGPARHARQIVVHLRAASGSHDRSRRRTADHVELTSRIAGSRVPTDGVPRAIRLRERGGDIRRHAVGGYGAVIDGTSVAHDAE